MMKKGTYLYFMYALKQIACIHAKHRRKVNLLGRQRTMDIVEDKQDNMKKNKSKNNSNDEEQKGRKG